MTALAAWTSAHQREALRVLLSVAPDTWDVATLAKGATEEQLFRGWLANVAQMSRRQIDRAVRRVDGLATGRLVRETVWACRTAAMGADVNDSVTTESKARAWLTTRGSGDTIVRVTRIRSAS